MSSTSRGILKSIESVIRTDSICTEIIFPRQLLLLLLTSSCLPLFLLYRLCPLSTWLNSKLGNRSFKVSSDPYLLSLPKWMFAQVSLRPRLDLVAPSPD
jgi:hypothetical protein